ncbi:prepilin-type N-terminal cleavage/methylation domain-containing protein [Neokomagataea thailandica]|uniref:prepilin-type N-terminal cleavage/methylation domain-containing protein n=1 Tax=Neokomagataea TaxID=1223423 RepID=UPI00082D96FC|nr:MULTISPECIES: prepilin-type N-terminal cleavage/methylation domain-containing protein [Neokomagataea]
MRSRNVPCGRAVSGSGGGREAGFTLLEMLVVLVIVGLLIGLVLTRGPLRSDAMTFSDGRLRVVSALQAARRDAVLQGHDVMMQVDVPSRTVSVMDGGHVRVEPLVTPVGLSSDQSVERITEHFSADGTADGMPIVLRYGRFRARITLSPMTGRVMVQNYGG